MTDVKGIFGVSTRWRPLMKPRIVSELQTKILNFPSLWGANMKISKRYSILFTVGLVNYNYSEEQTMALY